MIWLWIILGIELELFVIGFLYGSLLGDAPHHWAIRGLAGGLFVSLFYIAIPYTILEEKYWLKKF